jgi:hypothetical protein
MNVKSEEKKLECFEVNLFLGEVKKKKKKKKKKKGEERGGIAKWGLKVTKTRVNVWFNEVIINIISQL